MSWTGRGCRRLVGCAWRFMPLAMLAAATTLAQSPQQPAAPGVASPAPAAAATTVLEPGDVYLPGSRVYAFVGKTGFGHEHGVMGQLLASKLRLDATQDSGQLIFDMRSFYADSDAARKYVGLAESTPADTQREVSTNMLSSAVLDAARFPTASFAVRTVTKLPKPSTRGVPQYQLAGDFTLHGVTHPLTVLAEGQEEKGWFHLRGGFSLIQSQFGITPFTKAFGAVGVADEVKVYGNLWIAKDRQTVAATATPATR
jgi:polyisoprenoid-binding protein YceI